MTVTNIVLLVLVVAASIFGVGYQVGYNAGQDDAVNGRSRFREIQGTGLEERYPTAKT